jgi:hypothetical protein
VYQHCIPGDWGRPVRIAPRVNNREVNAALAGPADPVGRLWRWSNLAIEKQQMQYMAANFGTVGIRVVARDAAADSDRRVYLQFDHPAWIFDFNEDSRGNVTEVELRYTILQGDLGDAADEVEVVERITRTGFSRTYNGREQLRGDERVNQLGVCPYVILRHAARKGYDFGIHAYEGSEGIVHLINQLFSRQAKSVYDHAYPHWFGSASGPAPETLEVGGQKMTYVQTEAGGSDPKLEPLVARLDHNANREFLKLQIDKLRTRQPEMNLNDVELLSHTSGELIAQVLKPTEFVVAEARSRYLDALRRALQIGLSEMVRLNLADLGTGAGVEAAERAFADGFEDFEFADMPVLPETVIDKTRRIEMERKGRSLDLANARLAAGLVDEQEQLRLAGYTDAEAAAILRRKRTTGTVPQEQL